MGLKYYSKEFNNSDNITSLSSDIDLPLYANTSVSSNKKYPCSSRSSSSSETSMIKKYTETYTSIRNHNGITYHLEKNIYANISKLQTDISNDAAYATLINTLSITSPSKTDIAINSQTLDENNNNRIYENVRLHPTSSLSHSKTSSNNVSPSSSSHIYINLKDHEDKSLVISTSSPKTDQKEDIQLSSIRSIEIEQVDIETNVLEKRSNTKTKQTDENFELNMAPSCNDKSDLYRTKIPSTITRILPSLRQRRTLHRPRRYRRRSSTPFRTVVNSNTMRRRQQQHSNSNVTVHHPMITNNRRKRSSHRSVSNQLYDEMQQPILSDKQSIKGFYTEEIFECPAQLHGALQDEIISWYPTESVLIPQVFSTSENGESIQQDETATEEEEEQFYSHKTFEDSLLRRRSKSSCSTLASVTNTLISETISEEIPVRPPPLNSRLPGGIALSLDKKDVDFIHDIIQRTYGDQRVSNRIAALREAYVRAAIKRNDLLKTKKKSQINENKTKKKITMKRSLSASKIRDELEKYDKLPAHRRAILDDDDDDDDDSTYSTNDDYRYRHRKLPPVPSTAHRIINFVTSLKRQLQKNFHEIRSRILIEAMSNSSNHVSRHRHNSSGLSHRHRSRPKTSHNIIHRTNSHHSIERSYALHRHKFSRVHSNTSQRHSYHPSSSDPRLSHRPRTFRVTPHLQRRQRMN